MQFLVFLKCSDSWYCTATYIESSEGILGVPAWEVLVLSFVYICIQATVSFLGSSAASLTLLNIEAYYSVLFKDCPCPERKSQGHLCDLFSFLHHLHDLVSTYIFPTLSSLMALDPLLFQSQGLCTYRSLLLKCFTCPLLNELFCSNLYKMLRREKESYH